MQVKGYNGQVDFDGMTVTITRTGLLARTTVGKGTKTISVDQISAVQLKPAGFATNGFIQFTFAGGNERRSKFGSQTFRAMRDENSVVFTGSQQPAFEELRVAILEAQEKPAPVPVKDSLSIPEQISQLADLRDQGILSDEEFVSKKTELLDRM